MTRIRRLVLDVLKPHDPSISSIAMAAADVPGVAGVNVTLVEIDREVENVKLTVEGDDIDFDALRTAIEDHGGSVHSVDEFACGERLIEASETLQD